MNIKAAEQKLADRVWDWSMKAMIPIALVLGGLIASHERALNDHSHRLTNVERAADRSATAVERMAASMSEIQILLGRLEERLAAAALRK